MSTLPDPAAEAAALHALTDRDLDLIEIALDSAANSIQAGAVLARGRAIDNLDPLAQEYVTALHRIQAISLARGR